MEPTEILDAHIHLYAPEAASDPRGWGLAHREGGWVECVAPAGRRSIQGWSDPGALIADMDAAGVSACVMLGWYWQSQDTCELQNGWYRDWVRMHPDRLIGFAAVQPAAGRRSVEALERALDSGLCGVGELLPQAQGYSLEDPWLRRVVEVAAGRRAPLTFHATDPGAGPAAGPKTPLDAYVRLARDYPEATLILAHWGGGLAFSGLAGGEPLPGNLYFDTAASPLLYDSGVFRKAVHRVGAGRILYGSDYPLLVYPRTSKKPDFRPFLAEIGAAGLSPAERGQILGANLRRLLPEGLAPGRKRV